MVTDGDGWRRMEGLPENLAAATILGAILANLLDFIPTYNQISILVPPPPTLSLPRRLNPFKIFFGGQCFFAKKQRRAKAGVRRRRRRRSE